MRPTYFSSCPFPLVTSLQSLQRSCCLQRRTQRQPSWLAAGLRLPPSPPSASASPSLCPRATRLSVVQSGWIRLPNKVSNCHVLLDIQEEIYSYLRLMVDQWLDRTRVLRHEILKRLDGHAPVPRCHCWNDFCHDPEKF